MTGSALTGSALTGLGTMARIDLRTGWKGLLGWVLGLVAMMAGTASSVTSLYDTPAKRQGYAESLTGGAVQLLGGRVAGVDSLGGILANEFGLVLSLGLPLMAIALTAHATRHDEEAGRLELLRAARIGRLAPLLAAVGVVTAALLLTGIGCAAAMIAFGAAAGPSLLYGLGIAALGVVFVGVTAIAAQLVEHARSVWGIALAVTMASYLLRGLGAVNDDVLIWFSPHGWVDEARFFGAARAWPLGLALAAGGGLLAVAAVLSSRRDVGSAVIRPRASAPEASALLRSPIGLAAYDHRGAVVGWTLGAAALMATYGSLSQEILDAIASNPALGEAIGTDPAAAGDVLLASVTSTFLMMLAMVVAGFAIMVMGSLRAEEETGRLETQLAGGTSRPGWLSMHAVVGALGVLLVGGVGAVALAAATALSTGDASWFGRIVRSSAIFLPAALVFLALTLAVFGLAGRVRGLAWAVFAAAAAVAYLGPGLGLADELVRSSPFQAVGTDVLRSGMDAAGVATLTVLAAGLAVAGFAGFRRRDVPQG